MAAAAITITETDPVLALLQRAVVPKGRDC